MQKTKGNLTFSEKYKLVQWLEQNLAKLGGRTYESIAQEATQALGYHISDNVLENINRDEELSTVKWRTSRAGVDASVSYEQLFEEHKKLSQRVYQLEARLGDLLSVKRNNPVLPLSPLTPLAPYTEPYKVTCGDPTISQIFKGNEPAKA